MITKILFIGSVFIFGFIVGRMSMRFEKGTLTITWPPAIKLVKK